MASKDDQGQASEQPAEDYWLECIKKWYPELHSQTYFLPPLHFNRVPYSVENIAGEQVLVAQAAGGGSSQVSSTAKSAECRPRKQKSKTRTFSLLSRIFGLKGRNNQDNLILQPVQDSDVRDDRAQERVLHCLRALADNSQPKEVMMVISQLQFGKYLGEPSYAAAAALLPRPSTLPEHFRRQKYDQGDFDVLIIHRQHGLMALEIKSVGDNFSQLKMTTQQEDESVMKKVREAIKQLNKAGEVLKHLTSDLTPNVNVTKILVMPNISSGQLLRAIEMNPDDKQVLCRCLGAHSVEDAVQLCLLSDQLSDKRTLSDINHIALNDLGVWWQQVIRTSGPQPLITSTAYERLVARFCGPATTVEIHCVTTPRLEIRILGEAVSETGERMARLVLFPEQVTFLNRSPPRVFLSGPPGTGKTIVLILQGLNWLQRGYDVHVVSTWYGSQAVTKLIENQLQETTKTTTSSCIHRHHFDLRKDLNRHQFDFRKYREMKTAVRDLEFLSQGKQLCMIADEVIEDRNTFQRFCDQLIAQVPEVYLCSASVRHEVKPSCLEEVKLTTPLRSPLVVVREVMEAVQIRDKKQVHGYTVNDVPVPTFGPAVMRFTHSDGQKDHKGRWPRECIECGRQVARVLTELNVGQTDNDNAPPRLQYRDVLVLCLDYPTDDRVDCNGQVTRTASNLVQGLRAYHVPVRVVEKGDEAAIHGMAVGAGDLVTVTDWSIVQGLERKVVVVENGGANLFDRLYTMSRCTSQLVLIEC